MTAAPRAGLAIAALLIAGVAHGDRTDIVDGQLTALAHGPDPRREILLRALPNEDRVLVTLVACLHDDDGDLRRACAERLATWRFDDARSSLRRLALDALETVAVADVVADVRAAAAKARAALTHAPSSTPPATPAPVATVDVPRWQALAGSPAVTRVWGTHMRDVYAIGATGLYHSIDGGRDRDAGGTRARAQAGQAARAHVHMFAVHRQRRRDHHRRRRR